MQHPQHSQSGSTKYVSGTFKNLPGPGPQAAAWRQALRVVSRKPPSDPSS